MGSKLVAAWVHAQTVHFSLGWYGPSHFSTLEQWYLHVVWLPYPQIADRLATRFQCPAKNMLLGDLSKLGTESLGTYRSCLPFLHRKTVIVNLGSIRPLFHRNLFFDFPTGSQWVSLD